MSLPELVGRCREVGYCMCGSCDDPDGPTETLDPDELEQARAEANHEPRRTDQGDSACGFCRRRRSACVKHGGGPSYYIPKSQSKAGVVGDAPLSNLRPTEETRPTQVVRPKCPKCDYMDHPGKDCPILEPGSEFLQRLNAYFLQYWYEALDEPSLRGFMSFIGRRERDT